ncbi:hypothetical protein HS088_TW11G00943 [Tripterygium wilfordii]|uniref:Transmembrane protein n=1 Tax=Tripterygium wilfordii TaxID=458696 RepID=A0A7J7D3G6_TRIWF|nr:uncharacterized protein LOC120009063 [Tripterygium wilfordii]KAF5740863.1 hypothetical protein HS088_TW11G00943 [Tripterygium wilfordii]
MERESETQNLYPSKHKKLLSLLCIYIYRGSIWEKDPKEHSGNWKGVIAERVSLDMGWLFSERRGPAWKHGWTEQTLASISAPPLPLLAIFSIIVLLLLLSSFVSFSSVIQHTKLNFSFFLLLLPLLLILIAPLVSKFERFEFLRPRTKYVLAHQARDLPWGVVLLVVVLLVMVSYQSSLRSMWSPLIWRPN